MRYQRKLLLVFAFAIVIGTTQAVEAQTIYDVKGKIYGPDSRPLPNVLVTLENHAHALIGQDTTNTDGRYEFDGIVAGTYYISVKPDETQYQAIFQKIDLINTSIGANSYSTETIDFSVKSAARRVSPVGTVYVQTIPPEAEKEYQAAVKSLAKGDKEQATKQLRRAIEIFSTYFLALQQLGLLLVEKGSYEEASAPLKKAIEVNPRATQSHLALGITYVNLERPKEAIEELNVARTLDSRLFRASLYLGMALMATGDLDAAEKSLKQALALGGSVQARAAHLYLASIYNMRKNYRAAIAEMETYLRENPTAPNAANIKEAIAKLRAKL